MSSWLQAIIEVFFGGGIRSDDSCTSSGRVESLALDDGISAYDYRDKNGLSYSRGLDGRVRDAWGRTGEQKFL